MFDIHGNQIIYRGIHFATIDGKAWPSLHHEAQSEIINGPEDWVSPEDQWQAIEEAEMAARDECRTEHREHISALVGFLRDAVASLKSHDDPDDEALCNQIVAAIRQATGI